MTDDRERWQERHRARPDRASPSAFVARHIERLAMERAGARALDLACGSGRHAALLRRHGFDTIVADRASAACQRVADELPAVRAVVADAGALPFRAATFGVIVQTLFLERAIFPALFTLLARGGMLIAETFLIAQHATTGHPRPEFCLAPGELLQLCRAAAAVRVLEVHEGPVASAGGVNHLASIAACKV
jgi:SAM-dependent methyltransferase